MLAGSRVRWGFGDFFLTWAASLLVGQFMVAAVVFAARGGTDRKVDAVDIAVVTVASALVTCLVARFVAQTKGLGSVRADFGLTVRGDDWAWILVGIGLQVVAWVALSALVEIMGSEPKQEVARAIERSGTAARVVAALAVTIAAPVAEELLFRGILLRSALRRMRAPAAVALSAGVFALAHVLDPEAAVLLAPLALVGLVAAIRAVRSGDLSQSIWIHAGFNLTTAIVLLAA